MIGKTKFPSFQPLFCEKNTIHHHDSSDSEDDDINLRLRAAPIHSKRGKPKEALVFGKLSLPSILGNISSCPVLPIDLSIEGFV